MTDEQKRKKAKRFLKLIGGREFTANDLVTMLGVRSAYRAGNLCRNLERWGFVEKTGHFHNSNVNFYRFKQ